MRKSVYYWILFCIIVFISCGKKHHIANVDEESPKADSIKKMSIEEAEANMFLKRSDYNPFFSQSLSNNYRGDVFLQIQTLLDDNSLVTILSDIINKETGVPEKVYSLVVQEEPIDTLYLDDFKVVGDNIGSEQEIIKLIAYDRLWCTMLSDALSDVKKYEPFVKTCQNNIKQQDDFFNKVKTEISKYDNQNVPHIPFILVHQFTQCLSIYLEALGRNANYFFTGYSFQLTSDNKIQYIVEEFDF